MKRNFAWILLPIFVIIITSCGENQSTENDTAPDSVQQASALADTINSPRLVTSSNGVLLLTAENGRAAGPDIKYMPEWRAFGWFTAADSVEWDVQVDNPGKYAVHLEWSVSDEEAGKEFILKAGDQQLTGTVDKSGSWETFQTKNVGDVKLQQGTQKIVFKSKTKFDKGALLDFRQLKLLPIN